MKRILITAALGMLLSAVCMAAGIENAVDADGSPVEQGTVTVQAAPDDSRTAKELQAAKEQAAREQAAREQAEKKLKDVLEKGPPLWVIDPGKLEEVLAEAKLEGVFVGIGSATNPMDYQAIQMAEARARQDIAFQRQSLVKAEITDYAKNVVGRKNGSGSSLNAAEEYMVGQQLVETQLQPVKVVKREKEVGTGTWWVVVTTVVPGKPEAQTAADAESAYTHSPEASEAVKLMDERLERNKLKSTVVSPVVTEVATEVVSPVVSSETVSE
jgi:hypothetical protein